jgi:hypothetical protein
MNVIIQKSSKPDKKYDAIIDGKKTVSFGGVKKNGEPYSDFTKHKDEKRKQRYINRHEKNENFNDPMTSGFWAYRILWNKPTLADSIKDVNKRFRNLNVKLK